MTQKTTNRLLAAILIAQALQVYQTWDKNAQADTFELDYCITEGIYDKPTHYLHVVPHSLEKPAEEETL